MGDDERGKTAFYSYLILFGFFVSIDLVNASSLTSDRQHKINGHLILTSAKVHNIIFK